MMTITLVEEFPIDRNLVKLKLFDFPVNIFVAANSIGEFSKIETKIRKYSSVGVIGYWPILKIKEGYWISAFSKRKGVERIINELRNSNGPISVLWDAELPLLRKRLFLTEFPRFFGNRKIIQNFVANPPEQVMLYVAENWIKGLLYRLVLKIFAATFEPRLGYRRMEMLYGQLNHELLRRLLKLKAGAEASRNYYPIFGATAKGIGDSGSEGSWMRISPQKLDEQLNIAQELGIKEVVIYRLGGLDKGFLRVIQKYADK